MNFLGFAAVSGLPLLGDLCWEHPVACIPMAVINSKQAPVVFKFGFLVGIMLGNRVIIQPVTPLSAFDSLPSAAPVMTRSNSMALLLLTNG